jgi:hypothetical protein
MSAIGKALFLNYGITALFCTSIPNYSPVSNFWSIYLELHAQASTE